MFDKAPNGYFLRDLIVFNGLNEGGYVAKGFIFEPPDLNNAQVAELNTFQDQISLLLASLAENQLQVQYFCDSDYRKELLRYREETKKADNEWTRRSRNERFERYWKAMAERQLRRQWLVFYLTRRIDSSAKGIKSKASLTEYYENLLNQLQTEFEQSHEMLTTVFSGQGTRIIPMTDADHFRHYKMFLNPSLADRFDYDPIDGFDPAFTIQENCWHSEGAGQPDFGFFMDGHYHSMIVLSRWPKTTYPGIIHRLTNLRLLDYTITVNIDPLPVRQEIHKEEREHDRVAGDYASEKKLSLLTVMEKKQKKISALMQGHTFPFHVLFAVRAWDKSKEGLVAKTTAIKNAINGLNSAQYSESTLPSTSRKLFFQTWPGWTWGKYDARKLYGENRYNAVNQRTYASTSTWEIIAPWNAPTGGISNITFDLNMFDYAGVSDLAALVRQLVGWTVSIGFMVFAFGRYSDLLSEATNIAPRGPGGGSLAGMAVKAGLALILAPIILGLFTLIVSRLVVTALSWIFPQVSIAVDGGPIASGYGGVIETALWLCNKWIPLALCFSVTMAYAVVELGGAFVVTLAKGILMLIAAASCWVIGGIILFAAVRCPAPPAPPPSGWPPSGPETGWILDLWNATPWIVTLGDQTSQVGMILNPGQHVHCDRFPWYGGDWLGVSSVTDTNGNTIGQDFNVSSSEGITAVVIPPYDNDENFYPDGSISSCVVTADPDGNWNFDYEYHDPQQRWPSFSWYWFGIGFGLTMFWGGYRLLYDIVLLARIDRSAQDL